MTEMYDLNREQHVGANVDALGRKWVIHMNRQNGLCYARPEPDRSDAQIPKNMKGLWTKVGLLEKEIKKYVNDTWDTAEQAKLQAERKKQAAKEAPKKEK